VFARRFLEALEAGGSGPSLLLSPTLRHLVAGVRRQGR